MDRSVRPQNARWWTDRVGIVAAVLLGAACGASKGEGANPGECTDQIDNDSNGLIDCDDAGCAGSPDCAITPVDSGEPDSAPPVDTGDTEDSATPVEPLISPEWVDEQTWIEVGEGSFLMGATEAEVEHPDDEFSRKVTLTYDYEIAATEVSVDLYAAAMGVEVDSACGAECPVMGLTWHEAAAVTVVLSESVGLEPCYSCSIGAGETYCVTLSQPYWCPGYRLPTEAEWERAARADLPTIYAGGDDVSLVAWTDANAGGSAHPSAQLEPNVWGGYDFSGNAWEWCNDLWEEMPDADDLVDPTGPTTSDFRVIRGGGYDAAADAARAANRERMDPAVAGASVGLRLVRTLDP